MHDKKSSDERFSDINVILQRDKLAQEIKHILGVFEEQCRTVNFKKGIYVYGAPGCGKTHFVRALLTELGYDIIQYDAGDVRNKSLIDTLACNNISNRNVLELMHRRTKKIAIVMDEIDGMNNGDKGGITHLIKLIRQKKTKKQKLESVTLNPIVCIGNYTMDKKIKELMKVCHCFELRPVTPSQANLLLWGRPAAPSWLSHLPPLQNMDLRNLIFIRRLYRENPDLFHPGRCEASFLQSLFQGKSFYDDTKQLVKTLITTPIPLQEHDCFMNETDRTIVSLLFHENIADAVGANLEFYSKMLEMICFADYMDRITFQSQIWIFNEMSSLMKTFYNHFLYHQQQTSQASSEKRRLYCPDEIRFTKVLTKYSTEYNNQLFLYNLSQELEMDRKDVVALFQELRLYYGKHFCQRPEFMAQVETLFEPTSIRKLDIKRMYRFLDKNVKAEEEEEAVVDELGDTG